MKTIQTCPEENPDEERYKESRIDCLPSSTMPPTSPQVTQEIFDALLFTLFHENVTVYPDDVFIASPRRDNFRPPITTRTPVAVMERSFLPIITYILHIT